MTRHSTSWLVAGIILIIAGIVAAQLPRELSVYYPCWIEHPIYVPEADSPLCRGMMRFFYVARLLLYASLISLAIGVVLLVANRRKLRKHSVTHRWIGPVRDEVPGARHGDRMLNTYQPCGMQLRAVPHYLVRRKARVLLILLPLLVSTFAHAIIASQWVEVSGGAWHPDSVTLPKLEAVLMPAVAIASRDRGQMRKWSDYTFQYQGRISLLGKQYVFVNAFCGTASVNVRSAWVEVLDGGTCYFSAKYDPKTNRVYDVQVNGVA
jgi:hypothetical protein